MVKTRPLERTIQSTVCKNVEWKIGQNMTVKNDPPVEQSGGRTASFGNRPAECHADKNAGSHDLTEPIPLTTKAVSKHCTKSIPFEIFELALWLCHPCSIHPPA